MFDAHTGTNLRALGVLRGEFSTRHTQAVRLTGERLGRRRGGFQRPAPSPGTVRAAIGRTLNDSAPPDWQGVSTFPSHL